MILADLGVVERRPRAARTRPQEGPHRRAAQGAGDPAALPRGARGGTPLRALELAGDDAKRLRGFQFLSAKPLLLVLNLDEADLPRRTDAVRARRARGLHVARRDARRADLREDRARDRAARARGRARRSWPTSACASRASIASSARATTCSATSRSSPSARTNAAPGRSRAAHAAQLAAGEIHTDISRGFIRAEVVALRAPARARLARGLPRSRRAAARRQGVHRPRRRRHQLPPRDVSRPRPTPTLSVSRRPVTVRHVVVCEAQVPFVHGGAESPRARAGARAARARLRGRAGQRAVQVVSEGGESCRTPRPGGCSI